MSDFNKPYIDIPCSSAMPYPMTASGCVMPLDPRDMMAPEPIYETRIAKKEEPVSVPHDNMVETMKLLDYDPNKPLIDADLHSQEQQLVQQLNIRADARLALFMNACRELRESDPMQLPSAVAKFVDDVIDTHFDGRPPIDTTTRHSFTMKLVMKAAIMHVILSQDPGRSGL
ncbi:hypothetical protein pEaSNUABM37_00320 [Erwinia phage pEa_SNUABM_37]|nr:hypothetical protein pEaSNUABM37_00320 [Erwinia phage pEa_SNUABM_37]QXO10788.1 hypothetical protein pEaSNUABM48_00320 [Erwinia phage pEa_SNUABM_48]